LAESAPTAHLPGLDALRGLLVLAVAMYHLSVWFELHPSGSFANMAFAKVGNYGVSSFFILSGFLLFRLTPWTRLREEGIGRFYLKRWLRLAPVFYLAVLLNVALGLGMGPQVTPRFILENVTLCFGAIHPNHALVVGGWYVGLVVLLYVAYPLLAWATEKGGLAFLVLLVAALGAWSLPFTLHRVMEAPLDQRFHLYVQPGNQLFLLALGGLLAWVHARISGRLAPPAFLVLVALGMWLLLRPEPRFFDHLAALTGWLRYRYVALVAAMVLLFALRGPWPKALDAPLARLGLWSYGAYLMHPFLFRLVEPRLKGYPGFGVALVFTFLLAAVLERWLERPLAGLGRKKPARA
jgi:peptidoglycan/LPS O-acetylase OafA/YrhL